MGRYLASRLLLTLVGLWLVTVVIFLVLRVAPGDAVLAAAAQAPGEATLTLSQIESQRAALGLDRSYPVQYANWIADLLTMDSGRSVVTGRSVWDELAPRIAVTAELAFIASLLSAVLGVSLGLIAATRRGSRVDAVIRWGSLFALSVPQFWLGLITIIFVASWLGYFFWATEYAHFWSDPLRNAEQVMIPAIILAMRPTALIARVTRNAALDVLSSDYIRATRARGLPPRLITIRHVLPAALIPVTTVFGGQIVFLLGGAVVVESVFNLPGLGRALIDGVAFRDYPLLQFLVTALAVVAASVNLLVDFAYTLLDPRVRYSNVSPS